MTRGLGWHFAAATALVVTALAGCGLRSPDWEGQPTRTIAVDPAAAKRGEYIFNAANCVGCHTDSKHRGARLAGGRGLATPFGTYYSRNITPDPTYGIGRWTDADFIAALRDGVSPTGAHYFPAFPYPSFTGMTDADMRDLMAYLFTQTPQAVANKPHDVSFPFDVRATMVFWQSLYLTPGPFAPNPQQSAQWNRGAYLVNAVAHCGECHTPRDSLGATEPSRALAGNKLFGPDAKLAPNITSDPKDGIGGWSGGDITSLLKLGIKPDGDVVAGPMSDVVETTAKLTDADRAAIAAYLKTVPPLPGNRGS